MSQPVILSSDQIIRRDLREQYRQNNVSISRLDRWLKVSSRLCFLTFFAGIAIGIVGWSLSEQHQKKQNTIRIAHIGWSSAAFIGLVNLSLFGKKRELRRQNRCIKSNLTYWATMTPHQKNEFYKQIISRNRLSETLKSLRQNRHIRL